MQVANLRSLTFLLLVVLAAAFAGPAPQARAVPLETDRFYIDEATLPFTPLPGATAYWGVEEGAGWRIEVPANWNGDLVLYAHGYAGTGDRLSVSNPSIRTHLISQGFAWGASSYRANGYVPGIGAEDTYNLIKVFQKQVGRNHPGPVQGNSGKPNNVFLYGVSMGGHVLGHAVEKWPNTFAGALPVCGVMGDNRLFDYFQDVYVVLETLVGNEPVRPLPADWSTVGLPAARAQLGPSFPLVLNETGQTFKQVIKNLTGGERPGFEAGWRSSVFGANFLLGQASAGPGQTNVGTIYQFDDDPALSAEEQLFNDTIARFAADRSVRRPVGIMTPTLNSPAIDGKIHVPVLTLHTLGDLYVPFSMEQIYAERVAAQGNADLLVSRAIRGTSHCDFNSAETIEAFNDLVAWVRTGERPAGDDILNPAVVASPDFGCQFSRATRITVGPCPVN